MTISVQFTVMIAIAIIVAATYLAKGELERRRSKRARSARGRKR